MKELEAARLLQWDAVEKRRSEALAEEAERMNLESADARGEVTECGCCFIDTPWNRLVYCQGDDPHVSVPHFNYTIFKKASVNLGNVMGCSVLARKLWLTPF